MNRIARNTRRVGGLAVLVLFSLGCGGRVATTTAPPTMGPSRRPTRPSRLAARSAARRRPLLSGGCDRQCTSDCETMRADYQGCQGLDPFLRCMLKVPVAAPTWRSSTAATTNATTCALQVEMTRGGAAPNRGDTAAASARRAASSTLLVVRRAVRDGAHGRSRSALLEQRQDDGARCPNVIGGHLFEVRVLDLVDPRHREVLVVHDEGEPRRRAGGRRTAGELTVGHGIGKRIVERYEHDRLVANEERRVLREPGALRVIHMEQRRGPARSPPNRCRCRGRRPPESRASPVPARRACR